jgi:hypothetical protein
MNVTSSTGLTQHLLSFVPAALLAWLVTMAVGLGGAVAGGASHDRSGLAELVLIYPIVMSLPIALLVAGVLLPIVALVRAVVGPGRRWVLGVVGAAVAPVQGLAFLMGGWILFRGGPHMRATFAEQFRTLLNDPARVVPLLVAFAAGGAAFGAYAAVRLPQGASGTPASPRIDPTHSGW